MSIQNNFPAIKPTLLLDFANTEQLDPRITFTRASTATYYGTQTAKAEENLLLQSQTFETTWTGLRRTVTANTEVAPDGTTTADSVTQNSGETAAGFLLQNVSVIAADYVYSAFAKPNGKNFLRLTEDIQTGSGVTTWFDVQNGTVGTTGSGHTATITSVGNGWYRCSIKFTVNAARTDQVYLGLADTDNSTVVVDSGGLYLWGAQLEQRSAATSYTPTTDQPITNYIPVLESAASGVARFDHNPTTFESLGLLIEESRTNLVLRSEEFDDAGWTKSGTTITANTIVAPDGTLTGDKLVENTAAGAQHRIEQTISTTTNQAYAFSFYAKAGDLNVFAAQIVALGSSSTTSAIGFSITDGVITPTSTSNGIVTFASSVAVGNGWFRCSLIYTLNGTVTAHQVRIFPRNTGTYTGDGFSGIFIWGASLEQGAFSTSYIKTVASQVTRAADDASMTGANFSSWYNQAAGTLYAEGKSVNSIFGTTARRYAEINDGTTSNIISVEFRNTTQSRFNVSVSAVSQATITSGGTIDQFSKIAGAYAVDNFAFCANGTLGASDTSGTVPVVTQLTIGNRADLAGAGSINGTIKKISYYPLRVTNAQLQGLTL